jgi:ATP-dependent Lon protease
VCDIPWDVFTEDRASLPKAQKVLDRDHHGLTKVKERILEYLAVRQLNPDSKGPILCFVGPPGVGKTSLGRSIATALGRSFGRMALGGVKDETEIRGHRRTYVGALPGRLIRALTRAGTANPVIVLDELDKVGNDFRGDPASALLEVLDPEQNHAFMDHYVDVPVDLSQVLFIATANLMDPIPPALFDRLEIIEIPGYTEEEKVAIARKHLLPRLAERHGLDDGQISFQNKALSEAVRSYTREAGVRDLERQLATVHRKVARDVVEKKADKVRVSPTNLGKYLGPARYFNELAEEKPVPGVVVGLAWTAAGGDILFIEAIKMPGKRALKLTGSLGDVMKESAEAAMSWLRAHALTYGVGAEAFETEFHLHVPAGAIPKDGPSAGVTMVTALASAVTGRAVRPWLAMTGEITLRGKVLPVGGLKEKALAARRAGVKTILLPRHNLADLIDIPDELRKDLEFIPLDTIHDVLTHALMPA